MKTEKEILLTISEAAYILRSTTKNVYVMLHKKIFPHDIYFKAGKRKILFLKSKLLEWIMGKEE